MAFFEGLEPVEPGLVNINDWRPDGRKEEQSRQWIVFAVPPASQPEGLCRISRNGNDAPRAASRPVYAINTPRSN
jgi:S-adenosyl methyltransferase